MTGRFTICLLGFSLTAAAANAQQLDPRRNYSTYRHKGYALRGFSTRKAAPQRIAFNRARVVPVSRSYREELRRAPVFRNPYEAKRVRYQSSSRRQPVRVRYQRPLAETRPVLPRDRADCHPRSRPVYRQRPPVRNYQYRPVVTLTRMPSRYYVGRGLIGQPKVYVPGQPIRNFFRYLSP